MRERPRYDSEIAEPIHFSSQTQWCRKYPARHRPVFLRLDLAENRSSILPEVISKTIVFFSRNPPADQPRCAATELLSKTILEIGFRFCYKITMSRKRGWVQIGYARVSAMDQRVDVQLDALKSAGCKKIFSDKMSGARADRPGLAEAVAYGREGDVLVVWRLDRMGRTLPHLIATIHDLEQRGIGFRSLTEAIDTTTTGGKLVFHIFSALAEFERDLIRERTRAGLAAARQRGRIGGRPRRMSDEKIRAAKKLLRDGTPPKEVADIVGVSVPTLYRWLPASKSAA